jgi:hypothetical protein
MMQVGLGSLGTFNTVHLKNNLQIMHAWYLLIVTSTYGLLSTLGKCGNLDKSECAKSQIGFQIGGTCAIHPKIRKFVRFEANQSFPKF